MLRRLTMAVAAGALVAAMVPGVASATQPFATIEARCDGGGIGTKAVPVDEAVTRAIDMVKAARATGVCPFGTSPTTSVTVVVKIYTEQGLKETARFEWSAS